MPADFLHPDNTNTTPDVIRLAPDPYWPKDARVLVDSVRDEQSFFMGNKNVDYQQPLDIQKLIDYGPLDAALKKYWRLSTPFQFGVHSTELTSLNSRHSLVQLSPASSLRYR